MKSSHLPKLIHSIEPLIFFTIAMKKKPYALVRVYLPENRLIPDCPALSLIFGLKNKTIIFLRMIVASFMLSSCLYTKTPRNPEAELNLGFEYSKNGLPVNWILYDPPGFDYSISLDTSSPKEGRQSLRFDIHKSSEKGRVNFTGFTNEFPALTKGGGRYRLSFWIKNSGLQYRIYAGGTKAKESVGNPFVREEAATLPDWKKIEIETTIPADMWLRFEIQLKGKGSFEIDQVEIEKLSSGR